MKIVKIGCITAVLGDNIEYMKTQDWHQYHLAIVDPPYGISVGSMNLGATKDTERNYKMGDWDNAVPEKEYWDELKRISRNWIVWGGNYFTDYLPPARCFGTWDKGNDKMSFAPTELCLTSFDKNSFVIRQSRHGKKSEDGEKRHPTQKPVYLYDYLHLNFVEKKSWIKVIDTHGGSFTHAIAAVKNNINLTIIERDEEYFENGLEVIHNAVAKPKLLF